MVVEQFTLLVFGVHFGAAVIMTVLSFFALERHPGAGFLFGVGFAVAVIVGDWIFAHTVAENFVPVTWGVMKRSVVSAAAGSAVGIVLAVLVFKPEPDKQQLNGGIQYGND